MDGSWELMVHDGVIGLTVVAVVERRFDSVKVALCLGNLLGNMGGNWREPRKLEQLGW